MNRRKFIQTSLTGITVFGTSSLTGISYSRNTTRDIPVVRLGETDLRVPLIALGTGSHGGGRESNQTRLGMERFISLGRFAFDRGIRFFDMADIYGSHTYIRELLKKVPREKNTLLTKIWPYESRNNHAETTFETLDRFRMETSTDYFDILILHCIMNGNWKEEKKSYIDAFSLAKQKGIVKTVGISCHNLDALKIAAQDPWVDVIMARINPFGTHMDGTPEEVMSVLETARKNGKGVIGMKIFGNGGNISDEEREISLNYALKSGNIHSLTLGMESIEQIDDAVDRVRRIIKS